jgi:hypothetical protein
VLQQLACWDCKQLCLHQALQSRPHAAHQQQQQQQPVLAAVAVRRSTVPVVRECVWRGALSARVWGPGGSVRVRAGGSTRQPTSAWPLSLCIPGP